MSLPVVLSIFLALQVNGGQRHSEVKFGLFADSQYGDIAAAGSRYYRQSLQKLRSCVDTLNREAGLQFTVGLGDLIDRDLASFDEVTAILQQSAVPVFQVAGNHDFSVAPDERPLVASKLGLQKAWYQFTAGDWQFVFLDGNDVSLHAPDSASANRATGLLARLKAENRPNAQTWNGAVGSEQLRWLAETLREAAQAGRKVILFCHYPLLPFESHTLWNSEEVLQVIEPYGCVKACFSGHNHAGNYACRKGVHHVNLKGMVETADENAFAVVTLTTDQIRIRGFGREPSQTLPIE